MIGQRTRTAFHESAHAVVGAVLRVPIYSVSIIPDADSNGRTIHENSRGHVVTHSAILLAGGLAVWELGWRRGVKMPSGCERDIDEFNRYMDCLTGPRHDHAHPEATDEWRAGEQAALQILGDYWGAVEAVAAALLTNGTIRGELVHAVVDRCKLLANKTEAKL